MDTVLIHRLVDAVQRSLDAAGHAGFRLSYAEGSWFDSRRLFDYLDLAFERAISYAPCVLCFEDLDSLFNNVPLSHFLNKLDGLAPLEGVLVLATTNHPGELDEALTNRPSRFDRVFEIGNPGPAERRAYLGRQMGGAFDERVVEWTDGLSFAQVKEVWVTACLEAIHGGLAAPTLESAHRAARRLTGHRDAVRREFSGPVGFHIRRENG